MSDHRVRIDALEIKVNEMEKLLKLIMTHPRIIDHVHSEEIKAKAIIEEAQKLAAEKSKREADERVAFLKAAADKWTQEHSNAVEVNSTASDSAIKDTL